MQPYRLNRSRYSTHSVIAASVGNCATVLDVGCNRGYLREICAADCRFWGVDADPAALEAAAKNYEAVALADLDNYSGPAWNLRFDAIVFGDVLEHLRDPQRVLREIVRDSLAPGGKVVISLPNIANWRIRLHLLSGRFDYQDSGILDRTHLRFFTFGTAAAMIRDAGLEIAAVRAGSAVFGGLIRLLPATRGLLANAAIFECRVPREKAVPRPTSAG